MLTDKNGKKTTLELRQQKRSQTGDNLYVKVDNQSQVDVVSADAQTYLDKSLHDYRDMNLIAATSDTIQRLRIQNPSSTIELSKNGGKWVMVSPHKWNVESSATDDLLSTLTSLRAASFVDQPLPEAMYQFNKPQLVVTYLSSPSGATAATQPSETKIVFGGYDDVRKQNVFANANGSVVKIAASTMDSLNKSPLDLRDKTVVDIDGASVERIELKKILPATTKPTSRPASNIALDIVRNSKHGSNTAKPTTQPTAPAWIFANDIKAKVNDANVDDLLASLHPLKTEKYVRRNFRRRCQRIISI